MNNLAISVLSSERREIIPIYISNKMEEVSYYETLFLIKIVTKQKSLIHITFFINV